MNTSKWKVGCLGAAALLVFGCADGTEPEGCRADSECVQDGDACNGSLVCNQSTGECELAPESVVDCPASSLPCRSVNCDPESGACVESVQVLGTQCDLDGDPCTVDRCDLAGVCLFEEVDGTSPGCGGGGEVCNDSVDNDGDGTVDCADPDCSGQAGAAGEPCEPGRETSCDDGFDNDGDGAADAVDGDCREPPSVFAGFRSSRYGISPFPDPGYWVEVGQEMASKFEGAAPAGVWIVGVAGDDGECYLSFPGDGVSDPPVYFRSDDVNESYLDAFDEAGVSVWLQVEPGEADVPTLIDVVLSRYGHHSSVVGFGVDVEWLDWRDNRWGRAVPDDEARDWSEQVRAFDSSYTLFLKHWIPGRMPPTYREGMLFVDDSQDLPSLDSIVAEFVVWGETFAPAPVAFQFGYDSDGTWWRGLDDPPAAVGQAFLDEIPNTLGLFWVDFTLTEVFPP